MSSCHHDCLMMQRTSHLNIIWSLSTAFAGSERKQIYDPAQYGHTKDKQNPAKVLPSVHFIHAYSNFIFYPALFFEAWAGEGEEYKLILKQMQIPTLKDCFFSYASQLQMIIDWRDSSSSVM